MACENGSLCEVEIDQIKIGNRYRKDAGDIAELARSIEKVGLLHPVVISPRGDLIDGYRRLEAYKALKRNTVPVRVVDLEDIVLGEFAANTVRKDFTISEKTAIAEAIRKLEREKAKERQREGGRAGGKASGKLPEASKGEAREKVATAIGMSPKTLHKAQAVVDAAKSDPATFGMIQEAMDDSGKVDPAYRAVEEIQAVAGHQAPAGGEGAVNGVNHDAQADEVAVHLGMEPLLEQARAVNARVEEATTAAQTVTDLKVLMHVVKFIGDELTTTMGIRVASQEIKKRIASLKGTAKGGTAR